MTEKIAEALLTEWVEWAEEDFAELGCDCTAQSLFDRSRALLTAQSEDVGEPQVASFDFDHTTPLGQWQSWINLDHLQVKMRVAALERAARHPTKEAENG